MIMGLFSKKTTQIIKFEQNLCNASVNDNEVLFVRVGSIVEQKDVILEVPFTHTALVIKGGGDCRHYKSGSYNIFENKEEIKNWRRGLSVEVIYMPKDTSVLIRWGTPNKITYRDGASGKVVHVGAYGIFGIDISNHEQFFRKVVGVRKEFDLEDFSERFSAAVIDEFCDNFLKIVNAEELTYDQFDANKKQIAVNVTKILNAKFDKDWGITLRDFIIEALNITEEDIERVESVAEEAQKTKKLKEHLAELERLDDKQWEREKYLRQLELQDKAAYYEILKVIGNRPLTQPGSVGGQFCPNCGHSYESTAAFCPSCGKRLGSVSVKCPKCNAENKGDSAFCTACGNKL